MPTVHKNLTGADLHEPKGADTAAANTVYVANGTGSGVWTLASSIITNQAFSTGDAKLTLKTTADTGWVIMNDGTIGDGSSGATTRANADTSALFTLLWNNIPDAWCPVSTGRGTSATADYAAHKTITLPRQLGRALILSGTGSGLTARVLGSYGGEETHLLTLSELPTGITASSASTTVSLTLGKYVPQTANTTATVPVSSNGTLYTVYAPSGVGDWTTNSNVLTGTLSSGIISTSNNTGGTAHNNMQPWTAWNVMIKL